MSEDESLATEVMQTTTDGRAHVTVVVTRSGSSVGSVSLFVDDREFCSIGVAWDLEVTEQTDRRRIAERLLKAALQMVADADLYGHLELDVAPSDEATQHLSLELGFKYFGTRGDSWQFRGWDDEASRTTATSYIMMHPLY